MWKSILIWLKVFNNIFGLSGYSDNIFGLSGYSDNIFGLSGYSDNIFGLSGYLSKLEPNFVRQLT